MDPIQDIDRPSLLVLVRHAESQRNFVKKNNVYLPADESANIIRGVPDHLVPLTERGMNQAKATGPALREMFGQFDVVYDSGYLRTKQTRELCLDAYPPEEREAMKIRTSDYVRERFPGYTYDMTTEEANQNFPYLARHWEMFGPFYGRPEGGESQSDVCRTVYTFIGHLKQVRHGLKVLVFTHGGTIRAFRYNLEHWTPEQYMENYSVNPPENCGITAYRYSESSKRLVLADYNKVCWQEHAVA